MELLLWVYKYLWVIMSGILFIIWTCSAFIDIIRYLKSDRSTHAIIALRPSTVLWIMIVFLVSIVGSFSYWLLNSNTVSRALALM
jgi:hypothetical protein